MYAEDGQDGKGGKKDAPIRFLLGRGMLRPWLAYKTLYELRRKGTGSSTRSEVKNADGARVKKDESGRARYNHISLRKAVSSESEASGLYSDRRVERD